MSFLQSFFKRYIPTVKAEDEEAELVDPQKVLRVSKNYYIILLFKIFVGFRYVVTFC